MRILFCCEFYAPSVGGVQEVMKQVGEHLVARGHEVTVATRKLQSRHFDTLNGVKIVEFEMSGNIAYGMIGDLDAYRNFVTSNEFDVLMIKAAQQCTFDALWPVLKQITIPKVFIPCGFSGLHLPEFADYFSQLPDILKKFDHLIFYASDYRDINFAKDHGISNLSLIPNGASEVEFSVPKDPSFRERLGIGGDDIIFLTVGSFTGSKGHFEVIRAFQKMKLKYPATLILNGNEPVFLSEAKHAVDPEICHEPEPSISFAKKLMKAIKNGTIFKKAVLFPWRYAIRGLEAIGIIKEKSYMSIMEEINNKQGDKKVLIVNLPRPDVVQAYLNADLFVFASLIEYSPLVLYEAAAAGTPFLSVPVGNAEEIAMWTEAGQICPAKRDQSSNTKVKPSVLAKRMSRLVKNRKHLLEIGARGKRNWSERFTWEIISKEYEKVFCALLKEKGVN